MTLFTWQSSVINVHVGLRTYARGLIQEEHRYVAEQPSLHCLIARCPYTVILRQERNLSNLKSDRWLNPLARLCSNFVSQFYAYLW